MSRRLRLPLTLVALPALLLTLAAAMGFVLCTQTGLQAVVSLVQRYGGEHLSIGAAQGRLLGECLLSDVHYQGDDGLQVDIHRLHLRVRGSELLLRRLHLSVAEVSGLRVQLPPTDKTPSPPLQQLPQRLPLNVVIDALTLKDFQLDRAHETLLQIPQAQLAGSWMGRQLRIAQLTVELPQTGALQASGQALMSDDHVDVQQLTIKGPGELSARGRFGIAKAASDLQLQWQDLRWPLATAAEAPLLDGVSGSGSFSGPLHDYRFELGSDARLRRLPLRLSAEGSGSLDGVKLTQLKLAAGKGELYAEGAADWSPALKVDGEVRVNNLNPALLPFAAASEWRGALWGLINVKTIQHDGRPVTGFSAAFNRSTLRGHPLALQALGNIDERQVQLDRFLLQSGNGSVEGSGCVVWSSALRVDAKVQVAHFDPAQFLPQWRGDLNGAVNASTTDHGGRPVIAFSTKFSRSQLHGAPLTLAAQGELAGDRLQLKNLAATLGATRFTASGAATPPFDLAGKFDSPDLSALVPDLYGHASFDFKLQGAAGSAASANARARPVPCATSATP